eukprot:TRINITY_DN10011_c0_g1_i1.p1 TRINITY_DN10011_c0_g1~~TRINITY_DN10011_c0_g1_i1.p1  ORF type:complete len:167 (-),score=28.68 TRINITY_DN10011_c0_g1_i1:103-603(-)
MKVSDTSASLWQFEALFVLGWLIIGISVLAYYFELPRYLPCFGTARRLDGVFHPEDLRINQLLVQRHKQAQKAAAEAEKAMPQSYGSIGPCTWGHCEAPWVTPEKTFHPDLGEVIVRHGFCDTQYLRAHSSTWARDEPHFLQAQAVRAPPLRINEESAAFVQQAMV